MGLVLVKSQSNSQSATALDVVRSRITRQTEDKFLITFLNLQRYYCDEERKTWITLSGCKVANEYIHYIMTTHFVFILSFYIL